MHKKAAIRNGAAFVRLVYRSAKTVIGILSLILGDCQ